MNGASVWLAAAAAAVVVHGAIFVGLDALGTSTHTAGKNSDQEPVIQVALILTAPEEIDPAPPAKAAPPEPQTIANTASKVPAREGEVTPPLRRLETASSGETNELDAELRVGRSVSFQRAQVTPTPPRAITSPSPIYPLSARQRGIEGTVRCQVDVSASGEVLNVEILGSSGHRSLDRAARRALEDTPFSPARHGGQSRPGRLIVSVQFSLD